MAHRVADLVKMTATAGGTGNFVFTTADAGFQSFFIPECLAADGDTTWYRARFGTEWELGKMTRVNSTTVSRSVLQSSNADALVNFSGAPEVVCTVPGANLLAGFAAFSAPSGGSQGPFAVNTPTKLLFTGTEEYDPDGVFDSPNSRFIAPVTGAYKLQVKMGRTNGTTEILGKFTVWKNSVEFAVIHESTAKWAALVALQSFKFNAGDVIEFYFMTSDAATSTTGVRVQGELIRML